MSGKGMTSAPQNFVFYTANNGEVKIGVMIQGETVWLTPKQMAELFGVQVPAINKHLTNIFASGELQQESVISKMETTAADGKSIKLSITILTPSSPLVIELIANKQLNFAFGPHKCCANSLSKALP